MGGGGAAPVLRVNEPSIKMGANSAAKIYTIVAIRKVLMTRCMCVSICLNVLSNQSGIFDISFNFLALFSFKVFRQVCMVM